MLYFFRLFGVNLINYWAHLLSALRFLFLLLVVLSLYLFEQMALASLKHGVLEGIFLVLLPSFMKIIHVELIYSISYLPDERCVVGVPEVRGQNILGKLFNFLNNKSLTIFSPTNNVTVFWVLPLIQKYFKDFISF